MLTNLAWLVSVVGKHSGYKNLAVCLRGLCSPLTLPTNSFIKQMRCAFVCIYTVIYHQWRVFRQNFILQYLLENSGGPLLISGRTTVNRFALKPWFDLSLYSS
jgi:hypothetical protein